MSNQCEPHGWWLDDGELCPVCEGAQVEREHIVGLIKMLNTHGTHSERCLKMHQGFERLLELIGDIE